MSTWKHGINVQYLYDSFYDAYKFNAAFCVHRRLWTQHNAVNARQAANVTEALEHHYCSAVLKSVQHRSCSTCILNHTQSKYFELIKVFTH